MQELSPIKILHLDNPVQLPCCSKTAAWQWSDLSTQNGPQKWVGKMWSERRDGCGRLGKAKLESSLLMGLQRKILICCARGQSRDLLTWSYCILRLVTHGSSPSGCRCAHRHVMTGAIYPQRDSAALPASLTFRGLIRQIIRFSKR